MGWTQSNPKQQKVSPKNGETQVRPAGLEPATYSLEGCCSIQLSYGRVAQNYEGLGLETKNRRCYISARDVTQPIGLSMNGTLTPVALHRR